MRLQTLRAELSTHRLGGAPGPGPVRSPSAEQFHRPPERPKRERNEILDQFAGGLVRLYIGRGVGSLPAASRIYTLTCGSRVSRLAQAHPSRVPCPVPFPYRSQCETAESSYPLHTELRAALALSVKPRRPLRPSIGTSDLLHLLCGRLSRDSIVLVVVPHRREFIGATGREDEQIGA